MCQQVVHTRVHHDCDPAHLRACRDHGPADRRGASSRPPRPDRLGARCPALHGPRRDDGAFFTERARLPSDLDLPRRRSPDRAVRVEGHGVARAATRRDLDAAPGVLRMLCSRASPEASDLARRAAVVTAPNGTRIELVEAATGPRPPRPCGPPTWSANADRQAGLGHRAGRDAYRDLSRTGRAGASSLRTSGSPTAGPVPDYVHFHRIRFQMIYCHRLGAPRLRGPGRAVRAPSRRLRAAAAGDPSPGARGLPRARGGRDRCPAVHETFADHEPRLPTAHPLPERDFGGQRFVRHVATEAPWGPWRSTASSSATPASRRERRPGRRAGGAPHSPAGQSTTPGSHDAELLFLFVLHGEVDARGCPDRPTQPTVHGLHEADAVAIPAGLPFELVGPTRRSRAAGGRAAGRAGARPTA